MIFNIFLKTSFILLLIGCSNDSSHQVAEDPQLVIPEGTPDFTSEPFSIIISSGDTNHRGISSYNLDGTFHKQIINLRNLGSTPNGLAAGPDNTFLTSTNGADSILQIPYADEYEFFYGSSLLNGNLYDIEHNPLLDYYYVVETKNIEVFDSSGSRVSSARIPTTVGACTLTAPRNMHITDDGFLYVADYTAGRIHKYDVTTSTATCVNSYNISGTDPYAVIKHSNGLLYFTSYADDAVYTLDENSLTVTNIFEPGLSILRDPKALTELPDGHVIVSSSVTDSIERIDETGVRQGITPFIRDIYSLNITDIEVISH
ncbi:MAG: hypothetical protein ACRBBP_08715 [Bdellovibrionales bacterium]